MFIVHVATEIAHLAKAGGLGDVIYGLSKQLIKLREQVLVILPFYDFIDQSLLTFQSKEERNYPLLGSLTLHYAELKGIPLLLIEERHEKKYFRRGKIYCEDDDLDRFLFFSRVCVEYLNEINTYDCIHVHDWPAAMVISLLKELYPKKAHSHCLLTIHNMKHQGHCDTKHLTKLLTTSLSDNFYKKSSDPKNPSLLNIMKSAIEYADHITTVSPTYSKEIQTSEYGYSLDKVLKSYHKKITGILNGIDRVSWDPLNDSHLFLNYASLNIEDVLFAKNSNKKMLLKRLNLKESEAPLYSAITRLDDQKSPDLIIQGIKNVVESECFFVLAGTPSTPELKKKFDEVQLKYKNSPYFYYYDRFDEDFAHKLYACADFLLIPSLYEPCGLTQMIAMRYGTIPLARKTGGLSDTVFDVDNPHILEKEKTGLIFKNAKINSIDKLIKRALLLYQNKEKMYLLIKNCLSKDYSWERSALLYQKLYKKEFLKE